MGKKNKNILIDFFTDFWIKTCNSILMKNICYSLIIGNKSIKSVCKMNENQAKGRNGDKSRRAKFYTYDNTVTHCFTYDFKCDTPCGIYWNTFLLIQTKEIRSTTHDDVTPKRVPT